MHRRALCLLIALLMLTLPAHAGIGRLSPEMAKRVGGAASNVHGTSASAASNGSNASAQNGHLNPGSQPGTNPDGSANGTNGTSGNDSSHSNVGLFVFLALLLLGGTGGGIFLWMRKQQAR